MQNKFSIFNQYKNIFRMYTFIVFIAFDGTQCTANRKQFDKIFLTRFSNVLFLAIPCRYYWNNKEELLYRQWESVWRYHKSSWKAPFLGRTRLDDAIKGIKETISFTLILSFSSTQCDGLSLLLKKKKPSYTSVMTCEYEVLYTSCY